MSLKIPSKNTDLLQHFIGDYIVKINRQIFKGDMDLEDFEQMADGPIEISLSSGTVLCFYALSEINSIAIQEGSMSDYGESYTFYDVTDNDFWRIRTGKIIKSISILKSKYASLENSSEFGIGLKLDNGLEVYFEYLDEEDFPDTVRITEKYLGPECLKQEISPC